jgi:hypothetical protein
MIAVAIASGNTASFVYPVRRMLIAEQVETSDGPIFRLVKDHGNPLNADERKREDVRLEELVQKPGGMARVRQESGPIFVTKSTSRSVAV